MGNGRPDPVFMNDGWQDLSIANMATYNYFGPDDDRHVGADVKPYFKLGNHPSERQGVVGELQRKAITIKAAPGFIGSKVNGIFD